jgi:S1-C subfamily serine protease
VEEKSVSGYSFSLKPNSYVPVATAPKPEQFTHLIGSITPHATVPLGTAFIVDKYRLATPWHVISGHQNIVLILPRIRNIDDYQDTTSTEIKQMELEVDGIDPTKDLAILRFKTGSTEFIPTMGQLDDIRVGQTLSTYGFPHCADGRFVLTQQQCSLGAKILLACQSIKTKHGVINLQSRPGQSGSPVVGPNGAVVGMLTGTYTPTNRGGILISGINPESLNQTSHMISAEYLKEML